MKPSLRIVAKAQQAWEARIAGRSLTELHKADLLAGETLGEILVYIDEEHARRAEFEKRLEDFMHEVNMLPIWPPGAQK